MIEAVNKIKKILLVENQSIVEKSEEKTLRKYDYDVIVAFSGEEAVEKIKSIVDISLILMDVNLGTHMDGLQAAKIIGHEHNIPILFLSNHADLEIVKKTEKTFFYGYVVKDSEEAVLIASIEMALSFFEEHRIIFTQKQEIEETKLKFQKNIKELESYNKELLWVNERAKENETGLRENEEKFRAISEQSLMGICIFQNNKFVYSNEAVSQLTGYSREEFKEMNLEKWNKLIHPDDLKYITNFDKKRQKMPPGEIEHYEYRFITKTGRVIWLDQFTKTIEYQGEPAIFVNTIDITSRKEAQNAIKIALEEKNVLFHELQHRVKNSLALIVSLISLEIQHNEELVTKKALRNLEGRVMSLSSLYNILLNTGDTKTISLDHHLRKIVEILSNSFIDKRKHISLEIFCDEISVEVRQAICFGLILNELLTNSLKYAFLEGKSGCIQIKLQKTENEIKLIVSDDGEKLPESFDIEKPTGLGLQLVIMLVSQQDGSIKCVQEENLKTFCISIPI